MKVNQRSCLLAISDALVKIIEDEIGRAKVDTSIGAVLNFRDPDYSAEEGGYHPVEIAITSDGQMLYITDFSYVGTPPYAELAKELDFDFDIETCQQFDHLFRLKQAGGLFALWQKNFVSYYAMGVYTVTVGAL